MFSVIIATRDSERALVPTLAALVPGATAGIVREVIVADGGSRDETEQVADIAGCRFVSSAKPLGARLKEAAATARGEWLMFLRPGVVPDPTWIDETIAFVDESRLRERRLRSLRRKPAVLSTLLAARSPACRARAGADHRQGLLRRTWRTSRDAADAAKPTCCAASGGGGSSHCARRVT